MAEGAASQGATQRTVRSTTSARRPTSTRTAHKGSGTGTADVVRKAADRAKRDKVFARLLAALIEAPTGPAGATAAGAVGALNDARPRGLHDDFKAHALTTDEARQVLRLPRPQNLHTARQRGRLIGRTFGNVTYYPSWQFDGGAVRANLSRILELLGRYTDDAVAADRVMRLEREDLGDRSIIEAIDDPKLAASAWVFLADSGR